MKTHTILMGAAMGALLFGCSPSEVSGTETRVEREGPPVVLTVNEPLAYFARRIAGDLVEAEFPGPSDGDPAFWKPGRDDVRRFQEADLVLLNGAGYAKWLGSASLSAGRLVDTSGGFTARLIELDDVVTHSHGPEGDHSHGGTAFTTWLDPELAIGHARAVHAALEELLPDDEATLDSNLVALIGELEALHADLTAAFAARPDVALLGSHPVYQYLTRAFGLNLRAVHFEPDVVPDAEMMDELRAMLADEPAEWMLWEGEPLPETVQLLADAGVRCVVFDPCGAPPESGDFGTVMSANATRLRDALTGE